MGQAKSSPELPAVESIAIGDLRAHPRNSRTHSQAQISQIGKSIASFGWTKPVITDERLTILAGHGAVKAAESLGMTHVPVIRRHGLTDAQKRGYVIADNKIPLNAEWDFGILRDELTELDTGAFDMSVLGFSEDELENLGTWSGIERHTPNDSVREAVTCPGCGNMFVPGAA